MKPTTRWERFKRNIVWGEWPWRTFGIYRQPDQTLVVVSKLKIIVPRPADSGTDEPCGYCHLRPPVGGSFAMTGDGIRICKGCAA